MNKKKFLAMLLTAAMALSVLAGCGNKETPAPAAPAGTPDFSLFLGTTLI